VKVGARVTGQASVYAGGRVTAGGSE